MEKDTPYLKDSLIRRDWLSRTCQLLHEARDFLLFSVICSVVEGRRIGWVNPVPGQDVLRYIQTILV
jgi:hypothetical protein